MKTRKILVTILSVVLILSLVSCSSTKTSDKIKVNDQVVETVSTISSVENSVLDTSEMFTERDLEQLVELKDADYLLLESDKDIVIEEEGIYVLSGSVTNTSIIVEVNVEEKVQLVLDGIDIRNDSKPVVNIKSGDKVFITSTSNDNYMMVSESNDSDYNSVIYSKSDLVLNGFGTLIIVSKEGNGIKSKDDLKITGGTYDIVSYLDALEANDSIRIFDCDITVVSEKDAFHSENDEDELLGYVYIYNGNISIKAKDDAIHANSIVQIDGGTIHIETCQEGIEATYIQINDGKIDIYATDDGINATPMSELDVVIEVNGGIIDVRMASGDTDGFDSNGDIFINGGTITVEAVSAFDADGVAELNKGVVTINGEVITEIMQIQHGKKNRP